MELASLLKTVVPVIEVVGAGTEESLLQPVKTMYRRMIKKSGFM